jgi:hypothetical protein
MKRTSKCGYFENTMYTKFCSGWICDSFYFSLHFIHFRCLATLQYLCKFLQLCYFSSLLIPVIRYFHIAKPIGNAASLIFRFGQARALLEWHKISLFCGHCGEKTVPMEAGRRKQCSNESCKKRIYPRVDPVCYLLFYVLSDQLNDSVFCWRLLSIDLILCRWSLCW